MIRIEIKREDYEKGIEAVFNHGSPGYCCVINQAWHRCRGTTQERNPIAVGNCRLLRKGDDKGIYLEPQSKEHFKIVSIFDRYGAQGIDKLNYPIEIFYREVRE